MFGKNKEISATRQGVSAFMDEADKKFYEVAKFCGAKLITGNTKHFPNDEIVLTVSEFLEQHNLK